MKEYYIIVDKNDTPVSAYADEYQYWVDIFSTTIDNCDVYEANEDGWEQAQLNIRFMVENENRPQEIEFPLKVVKIESVRRVVG